MKKIFSVLLLQVITLIFPCWVMAVPEITVIPEIHYTAEGGFFRANIKLPIESFSEGIYVIPQVIEGDVFMVPALSQLVLPNNPDIKDGKMFKGSRDGHVTITGRYNKPGKSKIDILYKQILFPQATFQQLVTVTLVFPENGKENPAVLNNWAEQYQSYLSSYGGNDSFQMYWNSVIAPRFGLQATQYNSRRNTGVRPDPYSIFSGYAAIQESLQLEPLEGGTANIQNVSEEMPLTSLSGPSVKSHPFKEMLREKNPALPKLSFAIPFDQYAVFFKDFNKEIELSDLMNEWGGNLLQQVEVSSRNYYVKEKIVDQLCLEETFISRAFGDRVIDEVAFTGNDPFVKEGTAFTVLFYLKDKDTFLNQIQKRYTQAVREKGAQRSEYVISGQKIIAVTSADRRVSSYMVQSGNIAIVSNSMVASERIIETLTGKYISLAASEDFRYMRTIFPQDSQDEDIFVYFSDPHIRNLIGPRWKIGETRRLRCSANMLLISNARTWYLSEKKMEPTMGDLISGGYLGNNIPTCPEHGKYDLDKKTHEVVCSLHNRIGLLTPVGENPLTK